jgi:hypothetical protein
MTDVDLEREVDGALFLVVAFVVLEDEGNGGGITVAVSAAAAAAAAAAFLPFAAGLARGLGRGAVLKLPVAAALAFNLKVNTKE